MHSAFPLEAEQVEKQRPPLLVRANSDAGSRNVLVHSVHASHVAVVLPDQTWLADVVMLIRQFYAHDHLCADPIGSMPWQFDARVITLLSFHRTTIVGVRVHL